MNTSPGCNSDTTVVHMNNRDRFESRTHRHDNGNVADHSPIVTSENLSLSALLGVTMSDRHRPTSPLWNAATIGRSECIADPTSEDPMTQEATYGERFGIGNLMSLAENNRSTCKKPKIDLNKLIDEAIQIATEKRYRDDETIKER
jgi:hypothetical protein